MRDSPDMEDGKLRGLGIMSEVIAEWAFHPSLARRNDTFQNELRVCRNHHVDRLSANHGNPFAAKESGKADFVHIFRERKNSGHHQNRIGADDTGCLETSSLVLRFPIT